MTGKYIPFTDSIMFHDVLTGNPELTRQLLEIILDRKIVKIRFVEEEKNFTARILSHSIRLDVYVEGEDEVCDIEMQVSDEHNIPKRSRYYQGTMDSAWLKRGHSYNELKNSYVIFICTFDPFGYGRKKYVFRNIDTEALPEVHLLDDGCVRIVLNSKGITGEVSKDLQAFIDYLNEQETGSAFTGILHNEVDTRNQNEEWRGGYMTLEEEIQEREYIKYRQGEEKGRLSALLGLVHDNVIDETTGSIRAGMSLTEFRNKMAEYLAEKENEA